jgi:hypothetical protein
MDNSHWEEVFKLEIPVVFSIQGPLNHNTKEDWHVTSTGGTQRMDYSQEGPSDRNN